MQIQFTELTDSQWDIVKIFLPHERKRKYDLRSVVNAIFWIHRTGCQWRNLPSQFPPWKSTYCYFSRWSTDSTWHQLNEGKGAFEEFATKDLKVEVEISARPLSSKGFVPIKKRWVNERTFGWFNFFRRLDKDHEKTTKSSESMILLANIQIVIGRMNV